MSKEAVDKHVSVSWQAIFEGPRCFLNTRSPSQATHFPGPPCSVQSEEHGQMPGHTAYLNATCNAVKHTDI